MAKPLNIVVCGSLVPDPLQTLEPVQTPQGPGLKNEQMLPSVLDPWAACALYEAAALAKTRPGSKVTLVALGPKAKLQQPRQSSKVSRRQAPFLNPVFIAVSPFHIERRLPRRNSAARGR